MLRCRVVFPALAALAVVACTPAHPVKPLAPTYPDAIRTANAQGSVTVEASQSPMSWADSIDALEREGIRAANGRVTRVGDELRIRLRDGRMLVLKDDTAAGPTYTLPRYAGHLQAIRSHVVHVLPYEGSGNYRIIDDSTGDSTIVWGMPVLSPDGARFALTSMASEDGSDIGLIEVWKFAGRKPENEFSYDTSNEVWDPSDAVWRDARTIEFVKNSRSDPREPYVRTIGHLVRTGTKWVIAASNDR